MTEQDKSFNADVHADAHALAEALPPAQLRAIAGALRAPEQRRLELARALEHGAAQHVEAAAAPHLGLAAREAEILRLIGAGLQVKQVAGQLGISISSVNTYRNRIFRKMGVSTNAALIRYAILNGLAR